MVRKSLIVMALIAVSSPLAAQDEWVWTSNRPDGVAPVGVSGARTIAAGVVEFQYQWVQRNFQGVWFGKDSLDLATTLQLFEVAPLSLADKRHTVQLSYGVSDQLTVRARGEFALMEREQLRNDGTFFITSANGLGDLFVDATYNVLQTGPYRMDVNAGAIVPVGKSATRAVTPFSSPGVEVTPYDMRPGSGSFGLFGSMSADVQNEVGSLGAQFKFRTYLDQNSRMFKLGDRYEANGWAAYKINESFSVSAGARWEKWANIDGADMELAAIAMRDPMNDAVFLGGLRASMPLGINFVFPEDSPRVAGHRLSFETVYALHHDYEGPQIGFDWGLNVAYTVPVS